MPSSAEDKVVMSLGDALLRKSDIALLQGPYWLNDRVISFYFEYLHQHKFDSSSKICFISPEVSQFLKLVSSAEIPVFLEPLTLEDKEIILLAVNNAHDPNQPGGSHWSLLIFSRQAMEFFHLDSAPGYNDSDARQLARKLHDFLRKKFPENKCQEFRFSDVDVPNQTNGYDCGIHLLCHAEHATRHFVMFGEPHGLEPIDIDKVKKKREEILARLVEFAQDPEDLARS